MDNLVIFSSPWISVMLGAALVLHLLPALLRRFLGKETLPAMPGTVIPVINIALHAVMIVFLIALKASPEELFFVICLSSAVALTASGTGREAK